MPATSDTLHKVRRSLSLKARFTAFVIATLIILGALGGVLLHSYWTNYANLRQSRQFAQLAVLFSELGEAAQAETRGAMFELLFAEEQPPSVAVRILRSTYDELATFTDEKLRQAQERWTTMDKGDIDALTIRQVNDCFESARILSLWRGVVRSEGREVPDLIAKSEKFMSRVAHHLELGMTPRRARCQALWDLSKDGSYVEFSERVGTIMLYLSRDTKDAAISREISLHSEMLRYQVLSERENGLIAYLISKGARPRGLLSDDIGWLRSLWDRESSGYMSIWSLASEDLRPEIRQRLEVDSFPRIAGVRKWLAANWTNNDMGNWRDIDVSQISTPELVQDLEYTRDFACTQFLRTLRARLLSLAEQRLQGARSTILSVTIALAVGVLVMLGGLWWVSQLVLRRVWDLAVMVRHIQGTGDLTLRVPLNRNDEVGELEAAFNDMLEMVEEHRRRLEASHSVLESRVRERTAEVHHRLTEVERLNKELGGAMQEVRASRDESELIASRLKESNQQLLAVNQELESFIYSAAHDLRTPLRNIVGFMELMLRERGPSADAPGLHRMEIVISEARRLGTLIDGLLSFFRVGRAEMHPEPVFIGQVVEGIRADYASRTTGRGIQWRVADMPACMGDPGLIRQLFEIMLDNAVKFTSKRNDAVIEVGSFTRDGGLVYFVRDNGVGFDPRYSDKLFRVFQRLHNPRDFDGNGIGLANMKRIVARHGGRVWAEGAPGLGACFYFSLPMGNSGKDAPA